MGYKIKQFLRAINGGKKLFLSAAKIQKMNGSNSSLHRDYVVKTSSKAAETYDKY